MAGAVHKISLKQCKSRIAAILLNICAYSFLLGAIFTATNYAEYKVTYIHEYLEHKDQFEDLNLQIDSLNETAEKSEDTEAKPIPKFEFPSFLSHLFAVIDSGGLFWFMIQFACLALGINIFKWCFNNHKKHLHEPDL